MGIMKSKVGMLGLFALAAMGGMGSQMSGLHEPPRRMRSSNYKRESKPYKFLQSEDIPKGHLVECMSFQFSISNHIVKATVLISGGTKKSLMKSREKTRGELYEYMEKTGIQDLIKFRQFEITEIKPEHIQEKFD